MACRGCAGRLKGLRAHYSQCKPIIRVNRQRMHKSIYPDPREDPKSRSLNGGSYKVPLVV